MDWIFDHLQLIILIAGAVAYWLNQRRRERQGEAADYDEDGKPENRPRRAMADTSEEAERTRRIQEEIRRKIMERRAPPPLPSPEVAPRPVAVPPLPNLTEILRPSTVPEPEEDPFAAQQTLERQRALAERMEELEAQRVAARRQAEQAAAAMRTQLASSTTAAAKAREEREWLAALRNPKNARRAIVLRELLGPPVGLR